MVLGYNEDGFGTLGLGGGVIFFSCVVFCLYLFVAYKEFGVRVLSRGFIIYFRFFREKFFDKGEDF